MLPRKNISLSQLALMFAVLPAALVALALLFGDWVWWKALLLGFLFFIACWGLFYKSVEWFIYRHIKLIYKLIAQTKATKREEFYAENLLPRKTLEEVEEDVSKWASEYRVEIERLESNVQFRKEFLMNLAHEIKTPIFSVQGYIDTLMDGAIDDESVRMNFLSGASKGIDRLANLVNDIDVITKLESNRLPLVRSDFVVQELIHDIFEELAQKAAKKRMELQIKKGCESPVMLHADEAKIRQVLVNLIDNAIKYGREMGSVTAGIYIVDEKTAYVEITDDGIGISEVHFPRIFERFYRTDAARARAVGGTGLGLAIVKHIVEAHHGTVSCRSTPDVGSSFGFTIDRAR